MAQQKTVVMGSVVSVAEKGDWTLWSDGQRPGRWWAYQRVEGQPTRWLEVRYVSDAAGRREWVEAR